MTWSLAAICILCFVVYTQASIVTVTPTAGAFTGTTLTSYWGDTFVAYRGVPYAEPPVGPLRFTNPRPTRVNLTAQDVYDATKQGPMCIQPPGTDIGGEGIGQEDCLYLNVFTPLHTQNELRKVLVAIHGGGASMGSGNELVPGDLVVQADIIVVTINYRFGWMGFLKGNTPDLTGNQGVQDQIMALRWVKDNIRSFGGDENDITVSGHSYGGVAVTLLSILEESKDLFTKGMVLSGSCFTTNVLTDPAESFFTALASSMNCGNSTVTQEETDAALACLRELPESVFSLPGGLAGVLQFNGMHNTLFPKPIVEMVQNRTFLREMGFFNKTFLASITNNEGPIAYYGAFQLDFLPGQESYYEHFGKFLGIPDQLFERALLWYGNPNVSEIVPIFDILTDAMFFSPMEAFMDSHRAGKEALKDTGDAEGNLYFLKYDHYPSYMPSPQKGMFHGMELTYIFDKRPNEILRAYYEMSTDKDFVEEDHLMRRRAINITRDFMKYGNRGMTWDGPTDWFPFDLTSENYLSLTSNPTVRQFPLKERREFWKTILPGWLAQQPSPTETTQAPRDPNSARAIGLPILFIVLMLFGALVVQ